MIMSATGSLVVTAGLLIIRTMPSRPGVGWWVAACFLQSVSYGLSFIFWGEEQTDIGNIIFYTLLMFVNQSACLGTLQFIGVSSSLLMRLLVFFAMVALVIVFITLERSKIAELIFVGYSSVVLFQAAFHIYNLKDSSILLNLAGLLFLTIGIHWLDYPILSKVDWFVPIGFMIGLILSMCLVFTLATLAMLQFKKITKDSEQKAIHAAIHDPLTGVYNRSHLNNLFEKYKTKALTAKGTFILLYLDLDGFKAVNDVYGHKAGDLVLVVITKRLKNWLGTKGDVVRIGGDEIVVLNTLRSEAGDDMIYGTSAAQRILQLIEEPIIEGDTTYDISASIGGCYFGSEFMEMEAMLGRADELMYSAKQAGKRRVHFGNIPDEKPVTATVPTIRKKPELSKELGVEAMS